MLLKYTQFQPFLDIEHSNANNTASLSNNNNSYNDNNQSDRDQNNSSANSSSNETPIITSTASAITAAATTSTIIDKMYPYVTNHPSSHSGLSGMPGFSGLEDKTCR